MPLDKGTRAREGYGRDDGRDQGRDEIRRILYIKGLWAFDGRDGDIFDEIFCFLTNQKPIFL